MSNIPILLARFFSIKLKYFSKKLYLVVHWEKQNIMLYVLNFMKGVANMPIPYMGFQCTRYSKWSCLLWVNCKNNKSAIAKPFKWSRDFWVSYKYLQVQVHCKTCQKYINNECRSSYGWYFTETANIAKTFDPNFSNDKQLEDLIYY